MNSHLGRKKISLSHTVSQVCTLGGLSLEPGVAGEGFDWSQGSEERVRKGSVSPDLPPIIFRPRKESLVDIEFDHERAAQGEQPGSFSSFRYLVLFRSFVRKGRVAVPRCVAALYLHSAFEPRP